jgi:hypothetical protein
MSTEKATVQFHYIKSNAFRVGHVDGAIGSPTPSGLIFLALYNERAAIPNMTVHDIESGQIGPERLDERVGKHGVVREIEFGAMMHVDTAKNLVTWLQEKIGLVQKIQSAAKQE